MCKSAPHSRQITTPEPHHSVFYRPDALPAAQPTASKHWRPNGCSSSSSSMPPYHQLIKYLGYNYLFVFSVFSLLMPSVLWHCWLGSRKGIRPVKNWVWGAGMVICLERGADLHMAQLMRLPLTVSCFSKIQTGFTFLVPAHPGSPDKGLLNGCVSLPVLSEMAKRTTLWKQYYLINFWRLFEAECDKVELVLADWVKADH